MRRIVGTTIAPLLLTAPSAFAHTVPYPHAHDETSMLPFAAAALVLTVVVSMLVKATRTAPAR